MVSVIAKAATFYRAGRQASKTIPGLRGKVRRGFMINLLLFVVFVVGFNAACVFFGWIPLVDALVQESGPDSEWLAWALVVLFASAVFMVSMLFGFRLSLKLMTIWYEGMVELLLDHTHPGAEKAGSHTSIWEILRSIVKEVCVTLSMLLLGLIPVVGSFLVLYLSAGAMGRSVYDPYIAVLKARGLGDQAPKIRRFDIRMFFLGLPQFGLAVIPVIGWIFLPWLLLHLVLGQSMIYCTQLHPPGKEEKIKI